MVGVHGFFEYEGVLCIAMEYVAGRSLKELLLERELSGERPRPAAVVGWGVELARGLAAVHEAGLLHRDLKPSNVRISESGRAVLVDFGLARVTGSSDLSLSGEFIGSPAYASPEQVRGERELDARTDVYSLGATLYHALCGRPAFEQAGVEAVLQAVLNREPEPLRRRDPELAIELELICARAMAKDARERYASANEMADDLQAVLDLRPIRARRAGPWIRARRWLRRNPALAGAIGVALLSMVGFAVGLGWIARQERLDRLDAAAAALGQARAGVAAYRASRDELGRTQGDLAVLERELEARHFSDSERATLLEYQSRVQLAQNRRDSARLEVDQRLAQAERLDPGLTEQANAVRADLLLERLGEALEERDRIGARFFMEEVRAIDPEGTRLAEAFPGHRISVRSPNPEAGLWIFRRRSLDELVPGAERRLVPVPWTPESGELELPTAPGETALEVLGSSGDLRPGDLVLELGPHPLGTGAFVLELAEQVPGAGSEASPEAGPVAVGDRIVRIGGETLRDTEDLLMWLRDDDQPGSERCELQTSGGAVEWTRAELRARVEQVGDAEDLARIGVQRALVWSGGELVERSIPPGSRPSAPPLRCSPPGRRAARCPKRSSWSRVSTCS